MRGAGAHPGQKQNLFAVLGLPVVNFQSGENYGLGSIRPAFPNAGDAKRTSGVVLIAEPQDVPGGLLDQLTD